MILYFDKYSINTDTFELKCKDEVRQVEPMVFDLLTHFAAHPDQVFSRDALIDAVWKGRVVSDATVATCVKNARKALDDTGETQRLIQTIRGRGFRFSATVTRLDHTAYPSGAADTEAIVPSDVIEQHSADNIDASLLILPFRCLSEDREINRIADSLALELSTILTRVPLLRISAQSERYPNTAPQPTARQLHDAIGVDLVVDGSVQDVAGRLTVTVQLANGKTGYRLWAETFALSEPLAEAMDRCVTSMVGKLEPQLHRAMYQAAQTNGDAPSARQRFLQASGLLVSNGWHHQSLLQAAPMLRQSMDLDPAFALAPALLSLVTGFGTRIGLVADRKVAKAETVTAAERALELDSMDSTVLGFTGCSLADVGYVDRGESLLHNAIDLNPTNAQAIVALGTVRIVQNELHEAVSLLSKGIEISPLDSRLSVWGALLAVAQLMSGDVDDACNSAQAACQRNDRTYLPRIAMAGARLAQDDPSASLRALAEARRIKPDLTPRQIALLIGRKLRDGVLALEKNASS